MQQNKFILLAISILLLSCKPQQEATEDQEPPIDTHNTSVTDCYRYANKADTIELKIIHVGDAITGTLFYNLDGKDKNKGTIQGNMQGDLLLAKYTFMSEGVQSTRQVAFKLVNNTFIEGYGDVTMDGGKVYFKNTDSLQFNNTMKLIEIPCQPL